MKQHQYHVTVQHLKDAKGQASTYTERLEFYTALLHKPICKGFFSDIIFK